MAERHRYVARSPVVGIDLPDVPKGQAKRALTVGQVRALADEVDSRHRALVYVMAYGGLRWGEAIALRRSRVDVLRCRIEVAESVTLVGNVLEWGTPKDHQIRTVRVPRGTMECLAEHLDGHVPAAPDALLFTDEDRRPLIHWRWLRNVFVPALEAAGLPADVTPHELRHTAASLMIANRDGATPKSVQYQLGHKDVSLTLNTYTHLWPDHLDDVMDRLDAVHDATHTSEHTRGGSGHLREAR